MLAFALIPASLLALVSARLHHSRVPEDPYAFPKYRVTFLNGLPILNDTVQRWMHDGLRGGEAEFLDQPWDHSPWQSNPLKGIEGAQGQQQAVIAPPPKSSPNISLELMKFGRNQYLCLIPPPPEEPVPPPPIDESSDQVTPGHTWSLLQPLSGTCLYHRHGWFTYSYCHNSHVRQFREMQTRQYTSDWKPEEDPEWEAYTLGRAPPTLDPGADLTVAEEAALAANVELARGPRARYLVQRWGDGTLCDKTGRKREIEVQFHCSMTTPDSIVFIKETTTCHYILHIATPRLCGEPGFKNRVDAREEAYIRCREILSAEAYEAADRTLPPADHPYKIPKQAKRPPPQVIAAAAEDGNTGKGGKGLTGAEKALAEILSEKPEFVRKALEKFMAEKDLKSGSAVVINDGEDGDEFVIELLLDEEEDGEDGIPVGPPSTEGGGDKEEGKTETNPKEEQEKVKTLPEIIEMMRVQQKKLETLKGTLASTMEQEQQKKASDGKDTAAGKKGAAPQRAYDRVDRRRAEP